MSPGYEFEVICVEEETGNVRTPDMPASSAGDTPAHFVFRVRPHYVCHGPLVGRFLDAIHDDELVCSLNAGKKSTMNDKTKKNRISLNSPLLGLKQVIHP